MLTADSSVFQGARRTAQVCSGVAAFCVHHRRVRDVRAEHSVGAAGQRAQCPHVPRALGDEVRVRLLCSPCAAATQWVCACAMRHVHSTVCPSVDPLAHVVAPQDGVRLRAHDGVRGVQQAAHVWFRRRRHDR
jgi:hypothetical protein